MHSAFLNKIHAYKVFSSYCFVIRPIFSSLFVILILKYHDWFKSCLVMEVNQGWSANNGVIPSGFIEVSHYCRLQLIMHSISVLLKLANLHFK